MTPAKINILLVNCQAPKPSSQLLWPGKPFQVNAFSTISTDAHFDIQTPFGETLKRVPQGSHLLHSTQNEAGKAEHGQPLARLTNLIYTFRLCSSMPKATIQVPPPFSAPENTSAPSTTQPPAATTSLGCHCQLGLVSKLKATYKLGKGEASHFEANSDACVWQMVTAMLSGFLRTAGIQDPHTGFLDLASSHISADNT